MAYNRSVFPESGYDIFKESYDLSPTLKPLAIEYQNLKSKATLTPIEVSRLNELMIILQDFIITPEKLNHFQDAVTATQKFFLNETVGFVNNKQTEMNTYVDTKKTEMQTEINKFSYKGAYSPSVNYLKNNFVDFNDGSSNQTYLCIENCIDKEPSSDPLFWRKLTIQGAKGKDGVGIGLKMMGAWNDSTMYNKDDAIQYGGILFASLVNSNLNNTPNPNQDTEFWAKAIDVTITVKQLIGTRNITTQTNAINFMTGEIIAFNKNTDVLSVYQNSIRLTKGVDYNIGLDGQSITKIEGTWDATMSNPIFFEFVVTRNQIGNDLIFSDGQSIQDNTVSLSKLTIDAKPFISSTPPDNPKVGQVWIDIS